MMAKSLHAGTDLAALHQPHYSLDEPNSTMDALNGTGCLSSRMLMQTKYVPVRQHNESECGLRAPALTQDQQTSGSQQCEYAPRRCNNFMENPCQNPTPKI
jgi:hypothetical protein